MRRLAKRSVQICLLMSGAFAVAGCTGESKVKLWDPHAPPEWAVSSIEKDVPLARAGSIRDVIDSDGRCMAAGISAMKEQDQRNVPGRPLSPTAIIFDMTECEVVKRIGPPDRIDIGVNARGERAVGLTYANAERAGLYRFRSGRLYSIERLPESSVESKLARRTPREKDVHHAVRLTDRKQPETRAP
jgi:hypothetical protein